MAATDRCTFIVPPKKVLIRGIRQSRKLLCTAVKNGKQGQMRLNLAWKPSLTPFLEPLSCHKQHIKKNFWHFFFSDFISEPSPYVVFLTFFGSFWTKTNFARGCQAYAMLMRYLWTIGKLHQLSILPQTAPFSEIWCFKVWQSCYFTSYRNGNLEKLHICHDFDGLLVTSKMFFSTQNHT